MRAILYGFKGSGKSYFGKLLEMAYGIPLIETDELVEQRAGMPIRKLVQEMGEAHFRALEHKAILSLEPINAILSLGGGALRDKQSLVHLKGLGPLIHIKPPKQLVKDRVFTPPLPTYLDPASPEEDFERIYSSTMTLYETISDIEFIPAGEENDLEALWQAINSVTYFGSPHGENRMAKP